MKRKENSKNENGFEAWGDYMGAKISKLEEQFLHSAAATVVKQSDLFAGISIFVNGYTNPSADELKRIMMLHGGVFHHYKRAHTTYTIASNLPDVKVHSITTEIIIKPQWVVDCLEQRKILDYRKYLLYTNHKPSQPKLTFGRQTERNNDLQRPVPKKDGDPNDISHAECMNLIGMLKNFNDQLSEKPPAERERQRQPPVETVTSATETVTAPPIAPEITAPKPAGKLSSMTATDPNFLSEFFNNSRLHHIATLGAGFKQHVAELRDKHGGTYPGRDQLRNALPHCNDEFELQTAHYIMHIDMDCFFVSVGLRKHPHLRGQPVAVTHSRGSEAGKVQARPGQDRSLEIELYQKRLEERFQSPDIPYESRLLNVDENNSLSEIASCSYEARKMGVKNGMFVGTALKLCPNLKTIPYDFEGYREVAFMLYNTIAKYTVDIEAVSCDEMFVDLTELIRTTHVNVMDFVSFVRNEIKLSTDCPCSAGVGANRLQARMATKKAKPDGQHYLLPDTAEDYMRDIPIADLPGVGPSTSYRLKKMGYVTCGSLQSVPKGVLQAEFGKKFGETLHQACRGIDERPLVYDKERKSVSVDVNYGIRFKEDAEVERFMLQLTEEIHKRLLEIKQRGKLVSVRVLVRSPEAPVETAKFMGHGLCDVVSKSRALPTFTDELPVLQKTVLELMRQVAAPAHELRGINIQISKFDVANTSSGTSVDGNRLKSMFQQAEKKNELQRKIMTEQDDQQPSTSKQPVTAKPSISSSPKKPKPSTSKRGRPAKQPATSKPAESCQSMMRYFTDPRDAAKANHTEEGDDLQGLDPEVLAALPDDIRKEAIQSYRQQMRAEKTAAPKPTSKPATDGEQPSTSQNQLIKVDVKFLAALPQELRKEVEKQIAIQKGSMIVTCSDDEIDEPLLVSPEQSPATSPVKPPTIDPLKPLTLDPLRDPNILRRANWRSLIEEWIDSTDEVLQYDVDLIAGNAVELVDKRSISVLFVFLRCMFRLVKAKNCFWHQAYKRVVTAVQARMQQVYHTNLAVERAFRCQNKDCAI